MQVIINSFVTKFEWFPFTKWPFSETGQDNKNTNWKKDPHSYLRNLSSCEKKAWKKKKTSGFNGNRTYDLCYASESALATELSSQLGAGHIESS